MFFKAHGTIPYNMFGNEYEMSDLTKSSITIDKTLSLLISVSGVLESTDTANGRRYIR